MTTGIIDVGGGFRAVYSAGVLDRILDLNIHFDRCYGISAGAGNLSSYIAGQRGRNYVFYEDYAFRKEYVSKRNLIKHGSFVNLDYAYGTLSASDGENPLNYTAIVENPCSYTVVACDAETGEAKYFDKSDLSQNNYDIIKASSSLPVVNKPYPINGRKYYDGGMADPIPLRKAFNDGCDKVVIILTRPKDFRRSAKSDETLVKLLKLTNPVAAKKLAERYKIYNEQLEEAIQYESTGRVLIIAPNDVCGVSTLHKTKEGLNSLYTKGVHDGGAVEDFLK